MIIDKTYFYYFIFINKTYMFYQLSFHRMLILTTIICILLVIAGFISITQDALWQKILAGLLWLVALYLAYKTIRFYTNIDARTNMTTYVNNLTQTLNYIEKRKGRSIFNKNDIKEALKSPEMFGVISPRQPTMSWPGIKII